VRDRRPPAVAGLFYPSDRAGCAAEIRRCRAAAVPAPQGRRAVAAVAPHAGWAFSGPMMAAALAPLEAERPDLVILFGADHHGHRRGRCSAAPAGAWRTPVGDAEVDGEAAEALAADPAANTDVAEAPHGPEHSIEVLLPFLVAALPSARILPVIVPPGSGGEAAGAAAVRAARRLGRRAVAVGSSDLTHYGPRYGFAPLGGGAAAHRWSKEENDREILDRAAELDSPGVEASARVRRNACGPGAMAAVAAAARELGAGPGILLGHTTSAEVLGEEEPDSWVGYAAMVFFA